MSCKQRRPPHHRCLAAVVVVVEYQTDPGTGPRCRSQARRQHRCHGPPPPPPPVVVVVVAVAAVAVVAAVVAAGAALAHAPLHPRCWLVCRWRRPSCDHSSDQQQGRRPPQEHLGGVFDSAGRRYCCHRIGDGRSDIGQRGRLVGEEGEHLVHDAELVAMRVE